MIPNNFDKFLVSQCQKLDIKNLVKSIQEELLRDLILKSEINFEDVNIEFSYSKTGFDGSRLWLKCPICSHNIRIIYKTPNNFIGCRKCLNLDYESHIYKKIKNKIWD